MKEIIADLAAKWGMFIFNTMDKIKNTTGIDVEKRMIKSMKKDEKMREEKKHTVFLSVVLCLMVNSVSFKKAKITQI